MTDDKKKQLFVISHTHWDREWYLSFNQFRLRLVNVIDKALELAKDERWNSFMLDGQTAPIEDYLEVKPDNATALRKAVEASKLLIGPWYVLADEFLESAEGLVRNLLIGHKIADKFGRVMKCGYVTDTFGHVWQLPQILSGFGIRSCYLFRGYPPLFGGHVECKGLNEDTPLEFFWRAPDGTRILTLHHITGYGNASNFSESATEGAYKNLGAVMKVLGAVERLEPRSAKPLFLIMNGSDHMFPDDNVPEIIDLINTDDEMAGNFSAKHATIEDYFAALDEMSYDLRELSGEMRGSAYTQVTPSCLSSRIYLKQASWRLSTELESYAEALNVVAWYHGAKYPQDQLTLAWKYLLKNHPHDSICGCSIDRVHGDMETRFAELGDMIDTLINGAMSFLWKALPQAPAGTIALPVINVTNWSHTGPACVLLNLPSTWQAKPLRVIDEQGNQVPECVITPIEDYRALPSASKLYPIFSGTVKLHEIEFLARDVPALGFKTWHIQPEGDAEIDVTASPTSDTSDAILGNEFLSVAINHDGTITVLDKQTGKEWPDLLQFADAGDDGDEYDYSAPHENLVILSKDGMATISPVEASALKQTCKMHVAMTVPACITKERARSVELKTLDVNVVLTVYANEPFLRVTIDVANDVEDHRLQACFPTGLNVVMSSAADHFMVMNRTIDLPRDDGWFQPAQGLYHTDGFVDLSDATTGLAVLVKGLPEFEIVKNMNNAIAITLFRSVGWLSRDGMPFARGHLGRPSGLNGPFLPTPDAQCKREMHFELAVMPHAGTWQDAKLWKHMKGFQVPLKVMVHGVRNHFYEPPLAAAKIKSLDFTTEGMISVVPDDLVLSALIKAETSNGIILRLFNPSGEDVQGTISLSFDPASVSIVNLNEEFIEAVMYSDRQFEFSIKPNQIMTFLVSPQRTTA